MRDGRLGADCSPAGRGLPNERGYRHGIAGERHPGCLRCRPGPSGLSAGRRRRRHPGAAECRALRHERGPDLPAGLAPIRHRRLDRGNRHARRSHQPRQRPRLAGRDQVRRGFRPREVVGQSRRDGVVGPLDRIVPAELGGHPGLAGLREQQGVGLSGAVVVHGEGQSPVALLAVLLKTGLLASRRAFLNTFSFSASTVWLASVANTTQKIRFACKIFARQKAPAKLKRADRNVLDASQC